MSFKIITWNIQVGSNSPIFGNSWGRRRETLKQLLLAERADIICTQEGLLGQIEYIDGFLPEFSRIGVPRDDGVSNGEHCAIYYNRDRFEEVQCGTFWLSDTPENYLRTWDGPFKRICSWMMVRTRIEDSKFWIFNTHFPLNPVAQPRAARLVMGKIQELAGSDSTILAGDFNCGPRSPAWKIFHENGFLNALVASGRTLQNTQCVFGIPMFCLDGIFVSRGLTVSRCHLIDKKVGGVFPSDHFGILAEIS